MNQMQEVFDTVCKHLVKQGRRAVNLSHGQCKYRASNGDKCAVGVLIPDDRYRLDMEGMTLGVIKFELECAVPAFRVDKNFLGALQRVHDFADSWDEGGGLSARGIRCLRGVADMYVLNTKVLDELL